MFITGGGGNLVQTLHALVHIILDSSESSHDGRGTKPVSDHGEVSEVSLNAGIQDWLRVGVAERRPVLLKEIHQFLDDQTSLEIDLFPPVDL